MPAQAAARLQGCEQSGPHLRGWAALMLCDGITRGPLSARSRDFAGLVRESLHRAGWSFRALARLLCALCLIQAGENEQTSKQVNSSTEQLAATYPEPVREFAVMLFCLLELLLAVHRRTMPFTTDYTCARHLTGEPHYNSNTTRALSYSRPIHTQCPCLLVNHDL